MAELVSHRKVQLSRIKSQDISEEHCSLLCSVSYTIYVHSQFILISDLPSVKPSDPVSIARLSYGQFDSIYRQTQCLRHLRQITGCCRGARCSSPCARIKQVPECAGDRTIGELSAACDRGRAADHRTRDQPLGTTHTNHRRSGRSTDSTSQRARLTASAGRNRGATSNCGMTCHVEGIFSGSKFGLHVVEEAERLRISGRDDVGQPAHYGECKGSRASN